MVAFRGAAITAAALFSSWRNKDDDPREVGENAFLHHAVSRLALVAALDRFVALMRGQFRPPAQLHAAPWAGCPAHGRASTGGCPCRASSGSPLRPLRQCRLQ